MTDAGFLAVCRHLPAAKLRVLWVNTNEITTLPAPFARFQHLQLFGASRNPWAEGGWQPTSSMKEDAKSALEWAGKLVRHFAGQREGVDGAVCVVWDCVWGRLMWCRGGAVRTGLFGLCWDQLAPFPQ